jgi:hypothetical protein
MLILHQTKLEKNFSAFEISTALINRRILDDLPENYTEIGPDGIPNFDVH